MDLSVVPYKQTDSQQDNYIKYKECMRNHAASIGGHANDGCGEFMPRTNGNPLDSLTCAACGCHRNFHRREVPGSDTAHHRHLIQLPPPPPPSLLLCKNLLPSMRKLPHGGGLMGSVDSRYDHDRRSETPEREEVNLNLGPGRLAKSKRYRTKFTQQQKDKMLEFAERIGWRIQRHDDVALNQFCTEVGIKRNVLKVWMHNNKNAHRRREPTSQSPVVAPPQPVGV